MYQLLHTFGRAMTTSDTGIFGSGSQTHQTIGKATCITFNSKFSIATTQDNTAADNKEEEREEEEEMGGDAHGL